MILAGLLIGAAVAAISGGIQAHYQGKMQKLQEAQIAKQEARARLEARQQEWQARKAVAATMKQAGKGLMALESRQHDVKELNELHVKRTEVFGGTNPMQGVAATERSHQDTVDSRTRHFGGTPVTNG